jgi:transcription elongation factor GreB
MSPTSYQAAPPRITFEAGERCTIASGPSRAIRAIPIPDVSKAFTKDDGPTELLVVRHRAPLPAGVPNYVTPRGLEALRRELAALGPETSSARRAELEQRIASAISAAPPADRGEIRFGARVRVRTGEGAGTARELQIVGVDEADPAAGAIAFVAPLARALLGHRAGDLVTVRVPAGDEELEVLAVAYDDEILKPGLVG